MLFAVTLAEGVETIDADWVHVTPNGDLQFLGDHTVGTPLGDCLITMLAAGTWLRVDRENSGAA